MSTDYAKQIDILNELWMDFSNEEILQEFIELNDVGLPLACFIANGIVESTPIAEELINETFRSLLDLFEIGKDTGFKDLGEISENLYGK